jgi:hypothetical protein
VHVLLHQQDPGALAGRDRPHRWQQSVIAAYLGDGTTGGSGTGDAGTDDGGIMSNTLAE